MLELSPTCDHADLADGFDTTTLAVVCSAEAPHRRHGDPADLQMPRWIWGTMLLCFGIFFSGLIAATGRDGEALFALVISIGYTAMYFGSARIMLSVSPPRKSSAFARGLAPLQTWTGPMETTAVAAQLLTVPACLALFGIAVAVIRRVVVG